MSVFGITQADFDAVKAKAKKANIIAIIRNIAWGIYNELTAKYAIENNLGAQSHVYSEMSRFLRMEGSLTLLIF